MVAVAPRISNESWVGPAVRECAGQALRSSATTRTNTLSGRAIVERTRRVIGTRSLSECAIGRAASLTSCEYRASVVCGRPASEPPFELLWPAARRP